MDRFGVYVTRESGPAVRVLCVARDGALRLNETGTPVPAFDIDVERYHTSTRTWENVAPHLEGDIVADILALVLVLGQPATLVPVGDQPDMPVWVVLEGANPTTLLANLCRRLFDTSSDQRPLAARA